MDGVLAINELNELTNRLGTQIKQLGKYGREYAEAEKNYKVALMQQSLRLRDDGMAVTLIDKVVYGKCAEERFKRDVAEVMYNTAKEQINGTKLAIRVLSEQVAREWGQNV